LVDRYLAAFEAGDHAGVLACLTDDVVWEVPGAFKLTGKAAFDAEIENPGFVGHPDITTARTVEAGNIVVAEGTVRTQQKDGALVTLRFCDVFELTDGKIQRLTSYLMAVA
jgi:ketosteroid isomerase-like protein